MKNIVISEKQLDTLVKKINENHQEGSYMSKQQLYTIAVLAYNMWEKMEEGEQLEDWMETKIAQAEQSILSTVKAFMYDEFEDGMKGANDINFDDIIIGR
jgi:ribosome-binding ATPase YchF (GTP1/OBG family)